MTEISDRARAIATRAERMRRLATSIEQHLLAEQAESMQSLPESASAPRAPRPDHDAPVTADDIDVDLGHSDPTPTMAQRINWFRKRRLDLLLGMSGIEKAFDRFERIGAAVIATAPGAGQAEDDTRCPGWTPQLRKRLGGCGNHQERWTRSDGTQEAYELCSSCRKVRTAEMKQARELEGSAV